MMIGTIIGDINTAMISRLYGMCERLRPIAARVPNDVAISVAKIAIKKLLPAADAHSEPCDSGREERIASYVPNISRYHFKEYASGSRRNIPSVKVKYESALNDNGMMTKRGAINSKKTNPQITRKT
ncbi:MAG: hypothetical protein QGI35_11795 [Arenicellales bacterium]|jgi:hypothetical protein|nr:hypothetical protein [Arenicellales bacterium]HJP11600.1 hypothetical protein [Arenicellales bacterium]